MRRRLLNGTATIAAALGLLALFGRFSAASPERVVVAKPIPPVAAPILELPSNRDDEKESLREDVARLNAALKDEQAVVNEALRTNVKLQAERDRALAAAALARVPSGADRPLAFPPDAPPAFRPSEFKAVSTRAAEDCGMNLEAVEPDCTEYPCIAFMKLKPGELSARYSMETCAAWSGALGNDATVRMVSGPDGGTLGFAWMPLPPAASDRPIAVYRSRDRIAKRLEAMGPW